MLVVPLTRGFVAWIDDCDGPLVLAHRWRASPNETKNSVRWYAIADVGGRGRTVYMHRLILAAPPGSVVDHRVHRCDELVVDNRRENIRLATDGQNRHCERKRSGCTSQYKGVSWYPQTGRWAAAIKVAGSKQHLGYFVDELSAALAYDLAAVKLYGPTAHLNLPQGPT